MAEGRPRFAPVVLGGLAAGALAAIAGNQAWASVDDGGTQSGFAAVLPPDASAPPVTALALVVLATWGVVLVSRGRPRRVVTWLGLLAAIGVAVFAVAAWISIPDTLAQSGSVPVATSRTLWAHLGVLTAAATVAMSVLATRSVARWPEMGRRYDAPGESGAAARDEASVEEQTNLDLWRAIDEGRDPTERATD